MSVLEVKNIRKSYNRRDKTLNVLNGIDLSIEKGTYIVIRGESGSGKSTFLGVLAGLIDVDEGSVIYNDENEISSLSIDEKAKIRRHDIVYMPQLQEVIPELSISENIRLVDAFDNRDHENGDANLSYILERLGLTDLKDEYPNDISGGELRRLVVARTLYSKPQVVLADEPTNDLDKRNREIIADVFREMTESGITVIVVTHDEELAAKADNKYILEKGKLGVIL
ncbi:MAG: ATP-binding cassette domain-containing protein [Eubacterium sp.]|nr:ATP-binding cassette domain-containing protein [Eubacterium sp.]